MSKEGIVMREDLLDVLKDVLLAVEVVNETLREDGVARESVLAALDNAEQLLLDIVYER